VREFVAHVLHLEGEPVGEFAGRGDRLGKIVEQSAHLLRGTQMPFTVLLQEQASIVERTSLPDAGEHVEDLALELCSHADAVGGEQRKVELASQRDRGLIAGLLFANAVALQLDIDVLWPEGLDEPREYLAAPVHAAALQGCGERTFIAAGHADQAFRVLLNVAE